MKRDYRGIIKRSSWVLCGVMALIGLTGIIISLGLDEDDAAGIFIAITIAGLILIQGLRCGITFILYGTSSNESQSNNTRVKLNYRNGIKRITNVVGIALVLFFIALTIGLTIEGWPRKWVDVPVDAALNSALGRTIKLEEFKALPVIGEFEDCKTQGTIGYYQCNNNSSELTISLIAALLAFPVVHFLRWLVTFIVMYVRRGFLGSHNKE